MKRVLVILLVLTCTLSFTKDEKLEQAPEIELTGVNGELIKLSSLRGKMVLVDFWASWCRPCRVENPHVVEAYLEFKDEKFENGKGFEVFSVSLDRSEAPWKQAISDDGLLWLSHVIDLKGTASQLYQVKSIPSAFLIDGKGNIIAQGGALRSDGLKKTLETYRK
ncbi:MAG: TlpA disulfide reductase family protein [Crocinitomicaceae bacterium]|jgi:thiol-disulfide isomerase/thioredoxin|nr:TlpA family protein disulfide reductase [Crocinitomicaceae bacterium]MDG1346888.1 TlpA disulfide reductase family protein [Crocinitomicaceae bacterium]